MEEPSVPGRGHATSSRWSMEGPMPHHYTPFARFMYGSAHKPLEGRSKKRLYAIAQTPRSCPARL